MRHLPVLATLAALLSSHATASAATNVTDAQGLKYNLPDGWTATKLQRGLRLMPKQTEAGEFHLIMRFDWGFTKADREKVHGVFDKLIAANLPHLKRTGDGWMKGPNGAIAVVSYAGVDKAGNTKQARYYFASMGKWSIAMMTAGSPEAVKSRMQDLQSIFVAAVKTNGAARKTGPAGIEAVIAGVTRGKQPAKTTHGAANVDRRLVGRWVRRQTSGSIGYGASAVSSTTYTFTFKADGTCTLHIATWVSASAGGSSALSRPGRGTTLSGKWGTQKGRLVIRYTNGTMLKNNYSVFSHFGKPVLKLFVPGGKPVYYRR